MEGLADNGPSRIARSVVVGFAAFVAEAVAFFLLIVASFGLGFVPGGWDVSGFSSTSRTILAVLTLAIWLVVCVSVLLVGTSLGAKHLSADRWISLFAAAALSGVALYWFLLVITAMNGCIWDVTFPLGGHNPCDG